MPINDAERKAYNNASAKKSRGKKYEYIRELKRRPCLDCGGTFPPECMDFDHVTGIKSFNISANVHAHGKQKILDEIAKCEIICANCHRIRTVQRRNDPESGQVRIRYEAKKF